MYPFQKPHASIAQVRILDNHPDKIRKAMQLFMHDLGMTLRHHLEYRNMPNYVRPGHPRPEDPVSFSDYIGRICYLNGGGETLTPIWLVVDLDPTRYTQHYLDNFKQWFLENHVEAQQRLLQANCLAKWIFLCPPGQSLYSESAHQIPSERIDLYLSTENPDNYCIRTFHGTEPDTFYQIQPGQDEDIEHYQLPQVIRKEKLRQRPFFREQPKGDPVRSQSGSIRAGFFSDCSD